MAKWKVGAGLSYSTIQSALDSLFALVGTTPFSETQTIEVHEGIYDEMAQPNAGLVPTSSFKLELVGVNQPVIDGGGVRGYGIYSQVPHSKITGFECRNTIVVPTVYCAEIGAGIIVYPILFGVLNTVEVYGNYCHDNGGDGMYLNGAVGSAHDNRCFDNGRQGIYSDDYCGSGTAHASIYFNTCRRNGLNGIVTRIGTADVYLNACSDNVNGISISGQGNCYGNFCYNNSVFGILMSNLLNVYGNLCTGNGYGIGNSWAPQHSLIYNNIIYGNTSCGIILPEGSYNGIYNNTIIGNPIGILIRWGTTDVILKNNFIYAQAGQVCLQFQDTLTNIDSDNNDLYAPAGKVGTYLGVDCTTIADWRTEAGMDAHSISVEPKLVGIPPFVLGGSQVSGLKPNSVSPLNGVGVDLSAIFTTDYKGETRAQWDLGALNHSAQQAVARSVVARSVVARTVVSRSVI